MIRMVSVTVGAEAAPETVSLYLAVAVLIKYVFSGASWLTVTLKATVAWGSVVNGPGPKSHRSVPFP